MKKTALVFVLLSSMALAQVQPVEPNRCSPQEAAQISAQAERATLEKVRQDMRAEGRVQAHALGVDDRDCLERARYNVTSLQGRAIEQCIQQTVYFRSCEVTDIRVSQHPTRLQPTTGWGKIDDYEIDAARCKTNAESRAVSEALSGCQRAFNRGCRIVTTTPASHTVERRRRYGLFGPKEDFQVCQATASALPDGREQVQCKMELVAKARIL